MRCQFCSQEITIDEKFCSKCGKPAALGTSMRKAKRSRPSMIVIIGGSFLAFCVAVAIYGVIFLPDKNDKSSVPNADSNSVSAINSVDDMKKVTAGTWCATGFYKIVISSDGTHYSWYLRRADTDSWPKKPDQTGAVTYKHERYGDTGNVYYEAQMDGLTLQADAGHPVNGYLDFAAGDGEPIGGINAASHDCQQYDSH